MRCQIKGDGFRQKTPGLLHDLSTNPTSIWTITCDADQINGGLGRKNGRIRSKGPTRRPRSKPKTNQTHGAEKQHKIRPSVAKKNI